MDLQAGFKLESWSVLPLLGRISDGEIEHHLEPKVMDVLVMLARTPGEVVLRDRLIDTVWQGRPVSDDALSKCVTELRKVLGDDARRSTFIETVPKRGYRLLPDVCPLDSRGEAPAATDSVVTALASPGRPPLHVAALAIIAIAIALIASFTLVSKSGDRPASQVAGSTSVPVTGKHTIAVLPFKNRSDDPADSFIVDGMHDDLITHLARFDDWRVISRTSVERYRDTRESLREIGEKLNASLIIEAGVQRNAGSVRINVQLVDALSDAHLWAATYDRELSVATLFDVQSEIVASVVSELAAALHGDEDIEFDAPTRNFEAYNEFVKGRRRVDTESVTSLNEAAGHFEKAIELDPDYADAYAALADSYLSLGAYFWGGLDPEESMRRAEPLLVRAIELDPALPAAHAANGLLNLLRQDMVAAEAALERAIELQPSYSRAYRLYASLRWRQQRRGEAIELAEFASSLDPESGPVAFDLGRYYDAVGRYDDATGKYVTAARLMPENALTRVHLGAMKYLALGEVAGSLIWYYEAAALDPESPSTQAVPAMAYLELGDIDRASAFIDRGLALDADSFWPRFAKMCLNLRMGAMDAAADDAERLLARYNQSPDALRTLRDRDLAAGNAELAYLRYARAHPELTEPTAPSVNNDNLFAAVDLARVLLERGETDRAAQLLAQALELTAERQRLGTYGYWLADVSALAMQGNQSAAIARLRGAIEDGYRLKLWYHLYMDPNLDGLRSDPAFLELRSDVEKLVQEEVDKSAALHASLQLDQKL